VQRFPDIDTLAQASEDEILSMWAGLGYYARARNMLKAARIISLDLKGNFPQDYKQAIALPGIGPYSAAAILSISFNQPFAVVDGNVQRVMSRLFCIQTDLRDTSTQRVIKNLADELLDKKNPGNFNEAVMELGALVCTPKNPDCKNCPVQKYCKAQNKGIQASVPFKSPPQPKKLMRHYVLLIVDKNSVLVRQRPAKGLLAQMWEFPYLEVDEFNLAESEIQQQVQKSLDVQLEIKGVFKQLQHIYSHIRLEYIPLIFRLKKSSNSLKAVKIGELDSIALHGAHKKILKLSELKHFINN
jgi:A/G-specific adenine glycosylase